MHASVGATHTTVNTVAPHAPDAAPHTCANGTRDRPPDSGTRDRIRLSTSGQPSNVPTLKHSHALRCHTCAATAARSEAPVRRCHTPRPRISQLSRLCSAPAPLLPDTCSARPPPPSGTPINLQTRSQRRALRARPLCPRLSSPKSPNTRPTLTRCAAYLLGRASVPPPQTRAHSRQRAGRAAYGVGVGVAPTPPPAALALAPIVRLPLLMLHSLLSRSLSPRFALRPLDTPDAYAAPRFRAARAAPHASSLPTEGDALLTSSSPSWAGAPRPPHRPRPRRRRRRRPRRRQRARARRAPGSPSSSPAPRSCPCPPQPAS